MMAETKTFYCLRCQHRFPMEYDKKQVVERSCPSCGSTSAVARAAPVVVGIIDTAPARPRRRWRAGLSIIAWLEV